MKSTNLITILCAVLTAWAPSSPVIAQPITGDKTFEVTFGTFTETLSTGRTHQYLITLAKDEAFVASVEVRNDLNLTCFDDITVRLLDERGVKVDEDIAFRTETNSAIARIGAGFKSDNGGVQRIVIERELTQGDCAGAAFPYSLKIQSFKGSIPPGKVTSGENGTFTGTLPFAELTSYTFNLNKEDSVKLLTSLNTGSSISCGANVLVSLFDSQGVRVANNGSFSVPKSTDATSVTLEHKAVKSGIHRFQILRDPTSELGEVIECFEAAFPYQLIAEVKRATRCNPQKIARDCAVQCKRQCTRSSNKTRCERTCSQKCRSRKSCE